MFYRTHHHHLLSNFNYFPQFSPFSHLQEMESSAGEDSKSGFEAETDEFSGGGAAAGDDFSVDELLDFSNSYSETEEQQLEEQRETEKVKLKATPLLEEREGAVSLSKRDDFSSLHDGELCFQAEGLESLEWLSHFMDDSFPDYSLAGKLPEKFPSAPAEQPCFMTPVQTKARTKRSRAGLHVWHVLSSTTEQSASPPSSTSSTTSFLPPDSPLENAPAKKKMKSGSGRTAQPRKCSHCGVTKTPQWRAGPLGLKTLCNACGVRYKSGRLLPEYRPACSPTFSDEMHSNNHRKVLEMRRKKETEVQTTGLPLPVQSI